MTLLEWATKHGVTVRSLHGSVDGAGRYVFLEGLSDPVRQELYYLDDYVVQSVLSGPAVSLWPREKLGKICKFRVHVGPCAVKEIAAGMREAGLAVTVEGTEHVWFEHEGANYIAAYDSAMDQLQEKLGKTYGLDGRRSSGTASLRQTSGKRFPEKR